MLEARTYDARGTREDIETGHKVTHFAALNNLSKHEVLVKRAASATCTSTSRYFESVRQGANEALLKAGDYDVDSEVSEGSW